MVFDSIVDVPDPSGRLRKAAIAPTESAKLISAPPCSTPAVVHRSAAHASRAETCPDATSHSSSKAVLSASAVHTATTAIAIQHHSACERESAASPEFHPRVTQAKDVAAGAVLVSALGSLAVGLLIFVPRLLALA